MNKSASLVSGRPFLRLLVIFIAVTPFAIRPGIQDFINLPQSAFIQVGSLFLFALWLIGSAIRNQCHIARSPLNLPIIAFLAWSAASLLWAHNTQEGITTWMQWASGALGYFLVLNAVDNTRDATRIVAALFASGLLVALLGIGQHLFQVVWVPQVMPPASTFGNKNMAVHYIILTAPLGWALFVNSRRPPIIWLTAIAFSLMAVYLVYTSTRAGWLAAAAAIVFFTFLLLRNRVRSSIKPHRSGTKESLIRSFWRKPESSNYQILPDSGLRWSDEEAHKQRLHKSAAAAVSVLIFLVLINLTGSGFESKFQDLYGRATTIVEPLLVSEEGERGTESKLDPNIYNRLAIWRNSLEMVKDHPLAGVGLGNFEIFYPLYWNRVLEDNYFSVTSQLERAHNDHLQILAELGLIGIVLWFWFIFTIFMVCWRLIRPDIEPRTRRYLAIVVTAGIVGLLVDAFFSFPFQRAIPPFVLMILIGTLAALRNAKMPRAATAIDSTITTFRPPFAQGVHYATPRSHAPAWERIFLSK